MKLTVDQIIQSFHSIDHITIRTSVWLPVSNIITNQVNEPIPTAIRSGVRSTVWISVRGAVSDCMQEQF